MDDLLARLCDPAPLAWRLAGPVAEPRRLPRAVYVEVRLGRTRLLLGRKRRSDLLHLHRRSQPMALLLLDLPRVLDGPLSQGDLDAFEMARQAARAPDVLARHALLLDAARLILHARGHAQGLLTAGGGLEAIRTETFPEGIQIRDRTRLPDALPAPLIEDVLPPALVFDGEGLCPGRVFSAFLDAPASAHAALALRAAVQDAAARLPAPWRTRFEKALPAA